MSLAACTGIIGDGAGDDDTKTGQDMARLCKGDPKPGPSPVRRLTRAQYNNTVRDLLGDTTHPADDFPPDESVGDFSNVAIHQTVSPLLAQGYQSAAEALAGKAVLNMTALLPCSPQGGEDACAKTFIASFGKRAYRRPLTQAESDAIFAIYASNRMGADFTNGVQAVLETFLQTGPFFYFYEVGSNEGRVGNAVPLTSWEMASRLSYLVYNSMPDKELFDAAEADQLKTPEQLEAQVRRMFKDPKARDASNAFFSEWLRSNDLDGLSKDPATYPGYTSAIGGAMKSGLGAFASAIVWDGDGRLETLLTSPSVFVDGATAGMLGIPNVSGGALTRVEMNGARYAGLLTQPAVLTVFAKPNQSSPVQRGKFVRERLLCQQLPPPPPNIVIKPPDVKPGQTTRERFAEHDKNPECAGCHRLMDPIGFTFENFDGIGRWRDTDQGIAVDATGKIEGTDVDGDINGTKDLATKLAKSTTVRECVAAEWFHYAMARGADADDDCSNATINDAIAKADGNLRELVVGITRTPAFRYRRAQ